MNYVKHFNIDGVETRQVACIELHGKPNAATEGCVGALGIDMDSPLHDVYKCVAVNGSIYTWALLSSGLSIMSATISGNGAESVNFPYDKLKTSATYVVKIGDLIIDSEGYLYQIDGLNVGYCIATYCGTRVVAYGMSAYQLAVKNGYEGTEEEWLLTLLPYVGENGNWWVGETDLGTNVYPTCVRMATGRYVGTGTYGSSNPNSLSFEFEPKFIVICCQKTDASLFYQRMEFVKNNPTATAMGSYVNNNTVFANICDVIWSGNTISWATRNDDAYYQLNMEGCEYYYVAFG